MKASRLLILFIFTIMLSGLSGCSAEKDISARRNLMMPEKTDLPRNSKYTGSKKKKTYKSKKQNKRKKKRKSLY